MTERRRVVVTGIGTVTPIGAGREGLWEGLRRERSAVRPISRFDASGLRSRIAAEMDSAALDVLADRGDKEGDRYGQLALACARLAAEDAELHFGNEDRERIGCTIGSALGGIGYGEEQLERFHSGGIDAVAPDLSRTMFGGSASCRIAIALGAHGPNSTNAMSCASGTMAVGEGFRLIRDGYADVMLSGGVEAPLNRLCFGAFSIIRAMSTRNDDPSRASRPFDRERDGFVMGEGGAILVLEEYARARARGAPIYAELLGYAFGNDAHHMTAPRPDGSQAARVVRQALADADVAPHDVQYVNAHGSSTPLNDPVETTAIKRVFGQHAARLLVSSTKAYYGHALGASGAIEAAICSLAISRQWLPPTLNLDDPDEGCDLDYIPRAGRATAVDCVVSNSFGFGGINASLVMRRPD